MFEEVMLAQHNLITAAGLDCVVLTVKDVVVVRCRFDYQADCTCAPRSKGLLLVLLVRSLD